MKDQILKLRGKVQHYAWGGYDFIPQLIKVPNVNRKPFAEYWLGAHPSASADVRQPSGTSMFLHDAIEQLPFKYLGEKVYKRFGELPYLLKVLDVREMLSIQVHPTKEEAEKGFEREEAAGIPIDAPRRNYKDRNHKPEVMIALSDFWLLHGFKQKEEILLTLKQVPALSPLADILDQDGLYGLYKHVMEMPQEQVDEFLRPVVQEALAAKVEKSEPAFWIQRLYDELPANGLDRGIFSIYFLNIVQVPKGKGIFQAAGVPHAYLEGQNVELMANSDNVLRGGLTPKHIDVQELLKHTVCEPIAPAILEGEALLNGERRFEFPVDDFAISSIKFEAGSAYNFVATSPEIILVIEGCVQIEEMTFSVGEAMIVMPMTDYSLKASEDCQLYKAYVPVR